MMNIKFDKIKVHFKENRKFYIGVGTGVAFAGITCLIMRERHEALAISGAYGLETADTSVTMRSLSFFSNQTNTVNVVTRNGRGHPGYLVRNRDTDEFFMSQREAAQAFNISENLLSKHLNGKIEDAHGHRFERVSITA
jgi:hypothetical protein